MKTYSENLNSTVHGTPLFAAANPGFVRGLRHGK